MLNFRVIAAVVRKDLIEWIHQPRQIVVTFMPPVLLMAVLALSVAAVGRNKIALVVQDNGPHAQQLVETIKGFDAFIVTDATPEQAAAELKNLQVEAVITIPAGFETAYENRQPDPVIMDVNNLNLDFTNDLRRSLPAAISDFYAAQPDTPIKVTPQETDLRAHDIGLLQFQIVPLLIELLTVAGVVNAGLAMAREWETYTIKEIVLAPVPSSSLIVGKVLAGWVIMLLFGAAALGLATLAGYFRPVGIYWLTSVLTIALVGLFSVGLGVALASLLRKEQRVMAAGITATFYLFFLSGGIAVVAFLPDWLRTVAHFIPTYYGIHALEMALFYNSSDLLGRDLLMLLGSTILALA